MIVRTFRYRWLGHGPKHFSRTPWESVFSISGCSHLQSTFLPTLRTQRNPWRGNFLRCICLKELMQRTISFLSSLAASLSSATEHNGDFFLLGWISWRPEVFSTETPKAPTAKSPEIVAWRTILEGRLQRQNAIPHHTFVVITMKNYCFRGQETFHDTWYHTIASQIAAPRTQRVIYLAWVRVRGEEGSWIGQPDPASWNLLQLHKNRQYGVVPITN